MARFFLGLSAEDANNGANRTPTAEYLSVESRVQLLEQRPGLLQIARVEAFGKPAIDRSEKLAGPQLLTSRTIRMKVSFMLPSRSPFEVLIEERRHLDEVLLTFRASGTNRC